MEAEDDVPMGVYMMHWTLNLDHMIPTSSRKVDGESIEEAKPYPLKAGAKIIFGGAAFAVHSIDALN